MHHGEVKLENVFMSEFWINILVNPMSDYVKEMRKLLIVMQKNEVIYRVSECDEKISSGHDNKMGANNNGKVKTYKILF